MLVLAVGASISSHHAQTGCGILSRMKQKNPFITKRLVFVAVCLLAASSALAWSPKLLSLTKSQREFNSMMREWTQNARTNMTVETTAKFRDTVLLPFMRREMPNPFVPGGAEAGKTWAKEANGVYDAGLRLICDENYYHVWIPDDRVSRRAGKLVEQGCEEPFILLLSAFDPEIDWINGSKESRKRFGKSREIVEKGGSPGFINVLLSYYSYRFGANRPGDAPSVSFRKWLAARSFTIADEIPVYTLCHAFCGTAVYEMFTAMRQFAWANSMGLAEKTMNEARSVAGGGVASKVPRRGSRCCPRTRTPPTDCWMKQRLRVLGCSRRSGRGSGSPAKADDAPAKCPTFFSGR